MYFSSIYILKHEIGVLGHSELLFRHSQLLLDKAPHWQICACSTSETPDTPGASDWAWISVSFKKWIADTWDPSGNNSLFASKAKPIFFASALLIWHMLRIGRVRLTVVAPRMEKEKNAQQSHMKSIKAEKIQRCRQKTSHTLYLSATFDPPGPFRCSCPKQITLLARCNLIIVIKREGHRKSLLSALGRQ